MLRARVSAAFFLVVFLALFDSGLCLRCYQCTSTNQESCKDPFSTSNDKIITRDCKDQASVAFNSGYLSHLIGNIFNQQPVNAPNYCYKFVLENGNTVRTCGEGSAADMNATCVLLDGSNRLAGGNMLRHCSVCNTDGCNGATGTAASLSLAAAAAFATYLLYH